jgi:lipoprotein-anchoring transpeptidase ErfK/SrfK
LSFFGACEKGFSLVNTILFQPGISFANSNAVPFTHRAKNRRSSKSDPQSWLYAVLSLGLIVLFVWLWWSNSSSEDKVPAPKKRPHETNALIRLEKRQYVAVTNALKELAQTAEKIKTLESPIVPGPVQTNQITLSNPPVLITTEKTNHPPVRTNVVVIQPIVPKEITNVSIEPPRAGVRHVETVLEAQIAMERLGVSSGSIDGVMGTQTHLALSAFQKQHGLPVTSQLDARTKSTLQLSSPLTTQYCISSNDLVSLLPVATTWLGKSEQPRMDYENILELLGEKSHANPSFLKDLNPNVDWNRLSAGTRVILPSADYPAVEEKAAFIRISLQKRILEAFDENTNLLVHFPCSIGHLAEKRPVGELRIETIIPNPNYTVNPAVFPESEEIQKLGRKLVIPAGPNNPVGMAWIGLNRPGYGIHGTPGPEQVGRTESHGCFRLANWNAQYLVRLVWAGMPVEVEP